MWKRPTRPRNDPDVTQSYNDGVVKIYTVTDTAAAGYAPSPTETLLGILYYEEQRLGIQRAYLARQNNIRIDRVVRVPRAFPITNQNVAVTEDGQKYRIDLVQSVPDVYPASLDLTLHLLEVNDGSMV